MLHSNNNLDLPLVAFFCFSIQLCLISWTPTTEKRKICSTKHQLIDVAIQTNVAIELIDKENLPIAKSNSKASLRSISTQTNGSGIARRKYFFRRIEGR